MNDQAAALATALAGFVVTAGIFTLSPGLDTAIVLRVSTTAGARAGWAAACGIGAGLLVWGLGAAFGITALMAASALAHVAMTLAWFALLVAMTAPLGRFLARPAVIAALDRLTGGIFMGFGVKLALTPHRPIG